MSEKATEDKRAQGAAKMIPVYIMGKKYEVPDSLTIMKAVEYAGYKYIRGCGCRGGICGACATVYRKPGDYHIRTGLACQTVVEPDMYLTQIPFFPANSAEYDFEDDECRPGERSRELSRALPLRGLQRLYQGLPHGRARDGLHRRHQAGRLRKGHRAFL